MKTIIAGCRDIPAPISAMLVLAAVEACGWTITEVIGGRAKGIDLAGEAYAYEYGIPFVPFPADWKKHGKAAGPIRNAAMAAVADALVAVWDGKSRGTKDMIDRATKKGLRVYVYRTDQLQEGQ